MSISNDRTFNYIKAGLVGLYLLLGALSIVNNSPVSDEPLHLVDGIAYHKFKKFDFGMEHPPLIRWWAGFASSIIKVKMPPAGELLKSDYQTSVSGWKAINDFYYARKTLYSSGNNAGALFFAGRLFILLLGIVLILFLTNWSKKLYGPGGAFVTLSLICLSPNMLAHAGVVTTDFGSVALTVIAVYFLWRFAVKMTVKNFIPSAIFWSLALSSKFTCLFYFIVFYIAAFAIAENRRKFILFFLIQLVAAIFLINLSYLFSEPVCRNFFTGSDLQVLPAWFRPVFIYMAKFSFLPRIYLHGMLYSFSHSIIGHKAYIFGNLSTKGWWYYFPAAFIIKTTFISLLTTATAILTIKSKKMTRDEAFYIVPAFLFMIFMMHSHINIGIRHILIIWPFVFLFCGRAALILKRKLVVAVLLAALIENLIIFPHYISQFNILFGGAGNGWKYLADSNIDWGQDLKRLARWWKKKGSPPMVLAYAGMAAPEYYGIKYQSCFTHRISPAEDEFMGNKPGKEYLAVSLMFLQGINLHNFSLFPYFLDKKTVKHCGYSIYVYDISRDAGAHMLLGSMYKMSGKNDFANKEYQKAFEINPSVTKDFINSQKIK